MYSLVVVWGDAKSSPELDFDDTMDGRRLDLPGSLLWPVVRHRSSLYP